MSSQPVIKTEKLRMVYHPGLFERAKVGLEELDLEVPPGSIYGYLGQNGAGKTTTIKILVGLQYAVSGQAWIMGTDVRNSASRRTLGFMPENPYFYEYLTADETLEFYGKLSGMERQARRKRADELIHTFGLAHARHMPMRDYSKGMRQRLGLAQAILHNPPLVIMDEPMSGLDPLGRRDIRNVILSLRDQGTTVFFSSHILGDVEAICDRVCVLNLGKKVAEGRISALLTGRVLEVELSASGIPAGDLPEVKNIAQRAWHDGALYRVLVDSEEKAQQVKSMLEKAGGTIRSMLPHKESLEEYFVRVTSDPARPDGAAEEAPVIKAPAHAEETRA